MQDFDPTILRQLRLSSRKRLTQADMAKVIGTTRGTYGKKEKGEMTVTIDDLQRLAGFYGISIQQFFSPEPVAPALPAPKKEAAPVEPPAPVKTDTSEVDELIRDLNRMLVDQHKLIMEKNKEIQYLKSLLSMEDCPPPKKKNLDFGVA